MNLPKFQNEKGFTLIETLSALSLLAVILLFGFSFLSNSHQNKDRVVSAVELQQKTNLLVTGMQQDYYDGVGTGEISWSDPAPSIEIKSLLINGVDRTGETPLANIDFDQPLSLDITTITEDERELTIQTAWRPEMKNTIAMP